MSHLIEIENLYTRFGAMVLRRCRFLLRNEADGYDAMQDVFMAAMLNRHALDLSSPSALLYRMATNICLNRIRDRRTQGRHFESDKENELLERIASHEDVEAATVTERLLATIWGKQPESSRVIAVMHYVDGMTLEEVAAASQMSVSGVRKRLRKLAEVARNVSGDENEK